MAYFFIIHVIVCVLLVTVILFQEGKAGGLTSVSDSSQSVFGAKGATSFLTKLTSTLAVLFMISSLFLNWQDSAGSSKSIASDYVPAQTTEPTEAVTAPASEETTPANAEGVESDGGTTSEEAGTTAPEAKEDDKQEEQ